MQLSESQEHVRTKVTVNWLLVDDQVTSNFTDSCHGRALPRKNSFQILQICTPAYRG